MKLYFKHLLFFYCIAFISCSDSNQQTNNNNKEKTPTENSIESISCDSALFMLIQSTDISTDLKNKEFSIDGFENDTLLIKISHRNEVEPGSFVDAADGFLSIDIKNIKIYQVLYEVDSLNELKCDKGNLEYYILHCQSNWE